jgi:hypothetical protein
MAPLFGGQSPFIKIPDIHSFRSRRNKCQEIDLSIFGIADAMGLMRDAFELTGMLLPRRSGLTTRSVQAFKHCSAGKRGIGYVETV